MYFIFFTVFVEIPWKVLIRPNDDSIKVISPLLHIATKLSSEPQVRKVWEYGGIKRDNKFSETLLKKVTEWISFIR